MPAAARSTGAAWWLTAEGRPVVVEEHDAPDVVAATADGLRRLAALIPEPATRDLVDRAGEAVATRPPREWDAVERRLFASPSRRRSFSVRWLRWSSTTRRRSPGRHRGGLIGLIDGDLVGAIRQSAAGLREGWKTSPRLRAIAIGVSVVAAVACSHPSCCPERVARSRGIRVSRRVTDRAPVRVRRTAALRDVAPARGRSRPPSDDVTRDRAPRLRRDLPLRRRPDVRSAFDEGSAFAREPLLPDAEHADIALVEDFGGVAVVRVADTMTAQYVTLVRQKDRWLVRAVETITDQPS